jgi:hypothetical protein
MAGAIVIQQDSKFAAAIRSYWFIKHCYRNNQ